MNEATERVLTLEEAKQIITKQATTIELLTKEIESAKIFQNNYINTKETAILLDVKPRTIRLYNKQGKITGRKHKKEGRLFFLLKEILAFRKRRLKHWTFFD